MESRSDLGGGNVQPYLARTEEGLLHDKDLCEAPTETPGPSLANQKGQKQCLSGREEPGEAPLQRGRKKKRIPLRERAGPTALKRIVGRGTER